MYKTFGTVAGQECPESPEIRGRGAEKQALFDFLDHDPRILRACPEMGAGKEAVAKLVMVADG